MVQYFSKIKHNQVIKDEKTDTDSILSLGNIKSIK